MADCRILTGANVRPTTSVEAKALIGKNVKYLRDQDIDKSGRGYFFPQSGKVLGVFRRRLDISGTLVSMSDIKEMTEVGDK
jgi:hypothetical protein